MAREKKPVHKVQMTEGKLSKARIVSRFFRKRNIIRQFLEEYDIESDHPLRRVLLPWAPASVKSMSKGQKSDSIVYPLSIIIMGSLEECDKAKIEEMAERIRIKEKYELLAQRG